MVGTVALTAAAAFAQVINTGGAGGSGVGGSLNVGPSFSGSGSVQGPSFTNSGDNSYVGGGPGIGGAGGTAVAALGNALACGDGVLEGLFGSLGGLAGLVAMVGGGRRT